MTTDESGIIERLAHSGSHVRFTRTEYLRIAKDKLITARSIPWLLKAVYFKRAPFNPVLDIETQRRVLREISGIGCNLNQATRALHIGMIEEFKPRLEAMERAVQQLGHFLLLDEKSRECPERRIPKWDGEFGEPVEG